MIYTTQYIMIYKPSHSHATNVKLNYIQKFRQSDYPYDLMNIFLITFLNLTRELIIWIGWCTPFHNFIPLLMYKGSTSITRPDASPYFLPSTPPSATCSRKESLFCLTTPLEHIDCHIIGYWTSSIWSLWHISRGNPLSPHKATLCDRQQGIFLYALSHRQSSTYHSLRWTTGWNKK